MRTILAAISSCFLTYFGSHIMDQILKSPRLKRVGLFCIVIVGLWYGVFRLSIFNCESGPDGNIPYYSPNCAYYVIYRQSLWEKISAPFTWSLATAYLYDKNGKLLYESKTSPGDRLMPVWLPNTVSQGDASKWWRYQLPTSPGDFLHPQNCLAQNK